MMKNRHNELYEADNTPSLEIVRKYREVIYEEEREASLALIHYRGGENEFLIGKEYCSSEDPGDRATGADILAQLGWSDRTYLSESVAVLRTMLKDIDKFVVYCAAIALGHRSDPSAIGDLLEKVNDVDERVRYGVVFGLSEHEDDRAINGLIKLSSDEDYDVRNWAVFELGSQIDSDSPAIREALREALTDPDHEIRGEALLGLARRQEPTIVQELINEWRNDDISILSIEAAEETGDSRLFYRLTEFTEILPLDDDPSFASKLDDAIVACTLKATKDDTK